jgi:hypothetical protein
MNDDSEKGQGGVLLTVEEARAAKYRRSKPGIGATESSGVRIANPRVGYICYIGPCYQDGSGRRPVCYLTETGCDECYDEPDKVCD